MVLALGLAAGTLIAWRLRRAGKPETANMADLELRRNDLETERDEIYARLRGLEGTAPEGSDREALELAAARALRDLDSVHAQLARSARQHRPKRSEPGTAPGAVPSASKPGTGFTARHPLLAGALLGGGMVALVAVLIFWAQSDARPAPANAPGGMAAGPASGSGGPPAGIDRGEPPLAPEVAQAVTSMRERIQANPEDLQGRRDLAELLLAHSQFFEAFQEANGILERAPADAVGNYVSGIVRYTMGQADSALEHLATAVASDPTYVPASIVRGIILLQTGDREGAIAAWDSGLAAVGGSDARLEHLLRLAREGRSPEEILNTPPPSGGPGGP